MKTDEISDMIEGFVDRGGQPVRPGAKVRCGGSLWTVEELCRKYVTVVLSRPSPFKGMLKAIVCPWSVELAAEPVRDL